MHILDGADPTAGDWDPSNYVFPHGEQFEIDSEPVRAVGEIESTPGTEQPVLCSEIAHSTANRFIAFRRNSNAWCEVRDKNSNALVKQTVQTSIADDSNTRVIAVTGSTHVYHIWVDGSYNLKITPLDATSGAEATTVNMSGAPHNWPEVDNTVPFDVCEVTTAKIVIAYKERGTEDLVVGEITWNNDAVSAESVIEATKTDIEYVCCAKWTTDEAIVCHWVDDSGGSDVIKAAVYDPSTGATPTVAEATLGSWATTDNVGQMAVVTSEDNTTAWVFWTVHESGAVPKYSMLYRSEYDNGSPGETEQLVGGNCKLWHKPVVTTDDRMYVGVQLLHYLANGEQPEQRLYCVLQTSLTETYALSIPVGKWLVDVAGDIDNGVGSTDTGAMVTTPILVDTDQWAVAGIELIEENYAEAHRGKHVIHEISLTPTVDAVTDFEIGNSMVIPGAAPAAFDGNVLMDQQFLLRPPKPTLAGVGSGSGFVAGVPNAGDYYYACLYEYTDAQGDIWRSPLSLLSDAITISNENSVTVTVMNLLVSRLRNVTGAIDGVQIVIYRSDAENSLYLRRLATIANNWNPTSTTPGASGVAATFSDTGYDNSSNEQEYTQSGSTSGNYQPEPYKIAVEWNNRIFYVPHRWRDRLIRYSHETLPGYGHGFSSNLYIRVPQEGGDITSLAVKDDQLIIFKEDAILYTHGRGLDRRNFGPGFAEPLYISRGLGAVHHRGVVSTPVGTMFESHEGIYMLGSGNAGLAPVGRPVKYETDENTVKRAVSDARNGRVIFFTDGSYALVYHYLFDMWTTWTNCAAEDAVVVDGRVYFKEDGDKWVHHIDEDIWKDYPSSWIAMKVRTAVMPLTTMFEAKRLWETFLAGYVRTTDCNLTIKIAYDGDPEWSDTLQFTVADLTAFDWTKYFEALGTGGAFDDQAMMLRWRGSRTRLVSGIQFEIQDEEA
jgi:hypothetical protein